MTDVGIVAGDECGVSIVGPLPLVYNGRPTEKGEWPWLVAMFVKSKSAGLQFQCGASLLSTTIVLTGNVQFTLLYCFNNWSAGLCQISCFKPENKGSHFNMCRM